MIEGSRYPTSAVTYYEETVNGQIGHNSVPILAVVPAKSKVGKEVAGKPLGLIFPIVSKRN